MRFAPILLQKFINKTFKTSIDIFKNNGKHRWFLFSNRQNMRLRRSRMFTLINSN